MLTYVAYLYILSGAENPKIVFFGPNFIRFRQTPQMADSITSWPTEVLFSFFSSFDPLELRKFSPGQRFFNCFEKLNKLGDLNIKFE